MKKHKHNKKRNVGLVYEMLLRYISENIIKNNNRNAKKAVKIIERRFDKSTELYKEFRLFNALINSTVSGTHIAASILAEAKLAARRCNNDKLEREKALLIKDINYQLESKHFFHTKIENYKLYATIQTLLNEWRKLDNSNLSKVIEYEKVMVEHLIREESEKGIMLNLDNQTDKLVFKVMSEKINSKYDHALTSEQKDIIRNYAIYANDPSSLKIYFESLKKKTISTLLEFKNKTDNEILLSKIDKVHENITNLSATNVDDEIIKKYLEVSNLKSQLIRSSNE